MNENQFQHLLDKYLKGKCTSEEIRLLHQFYASFQKEALEDKSDAMYDKVLEEKIHQGIKQRITKKERQQYDASKSRASRTGIIFRVAASLLILISIGIGSYIAYINTPASETAWMEKSTRRGQRGKIVLTDGTKVYLNADSKLSFPEHFHPDQREVILEGEAFFEVARNVRRPFIIKTGSVATTVLGTSFNIKAFEDEPLQVTVATGRVKVNALQQAGHSEGIILNPNQQAFYDGQLSKRKVDIDQYIAWREKVIHFDETSLAEAAMILERWFDVSIVVEHESMQQCKINGQYIDENLINIMDSFKHILGIKYRFEDDRKLIIEGQGCKSQN